MLSVLADCFLWSFPYYLLGAVIAGGVSVINRMFGWQVSILVLPIVYWIYRSYRTYLDRLEGEKKHTEEIAALHLRTIEALSLAIEAKDHTTHDHLKRVQRYAVQESFSANPLKKPLPPPSPAIQGRVVPRDEAASSSSASSLGALLSACFFDRPRKYR